MFRILLACGDQTLCESLRVAFEVEKDFVVCCESENDVDAIRKVINCSPDLIVLEMELPTNGDFNIASALKIARPETPIFLVTNRTDVYAEKDALSQGADAVFDKSQDFSPLLMNARAVCAPERRL